MFYLFDQNNSYGKFVVNDKVCHRLFIEADSEETAYSVAESLGCYWYGVDAGIDCPCCGDRWDSPDIIDIAKINQEGYSVTEYILRDRDEAIDSYNKKYGKYLCVRQPSIVQSPYGSLGYTGKIGFRNIEEYAQYLADNCGFTTPDARIYYKNGTVKEIFMPHKES